MAIHVLWRDALPTVRVYINTMAMLRDEIHTTWCMARGLREFGAHRGPR